MSQTDLSSINHSSDPPPSYDDIICSSNTSDNHCSPTQEFSAALDNNWTGSHEIPTQLFGDRDDSTEGYTTYSHIPTAPTCEAIGDGIFENVRPSENKNNAAIPIGKIPRYGRRITKEELQRNMLVLEDAERRADLAQQELKRIERKYRLNEKDDCSGLCVIL